MGYRFDPWLIFAVLVILGASILNLGYLDTGLVGRQLLWMALGLGVMLVASFLDGVALSRLAFPAWIAAVAALAGVLAFGTVRGGTRGWFALGGFTIQPSEFARLTVVLALAALAARVPGTRLGVKDVALLGAAAGIPVLLVLAEPDFGVAATYLPILGVVLWIGGLPRAAWVILLLCGLVGAAVAWQWVLADYQKERVLTVLDPSRDPYGAGYQVRQSKIAVGSGELVGMGFGRGGQSGLRFLPARHTDFAFAVWAEATGFVGSLALLGAYAVLLWRIARIALGVADRFGLLLSASVFAWIAFEVVVNVGMVVGWLPTTGITLPLFSYGGSSLVSTLAAIGMVQGVWRHRMVNR